MATPDARPAVLLVDDEPCILRSVRRILESSGYRVRIAASGAEALDLVRTESFHAVVCDLRMPGLSGVALFERIWEVAPELAGRVVVVSGDLADPGLPELLVRTGMPSLPKPFGRSDLLGVLARVAS